MRKRILRILLLGVVLGYLLMNFLVQPALAKETINIGVVGAMKYEYGQEIWNGAMMAADEINKRGGVRVGPKRMPIKLVKANSNEFLNVQYATNMMEMLFFQEKVDFVVGGFRSEAVFAMQDVAMDYKKIFVSIGAAMPELCQRVAQNYDRYKYYFRGGTYNSYYLAKACFLQLNYAAQVLRQKLGLGTIRVAIAAEKTGWVEAMIEAAKQNFPKMGLELAGVFRTSSVATDVRTTVDAIAEAKAPLVLTMFSSNVGTPFVIQAAEKDLPALMIGINVDASRKGFWEATSGKANYVVTSASYCEGVEVTKLTEPFLKNYIKRYGKIPTLTADSYTTIAHMIVPSIEQAGSLDSDILVNILENSEHLTPEGLVAFDKDPLGRPLHEFKFGADYAMGIAIQWVDGKMKGVWPNKYVEKEGAPPVTYKGIVDMKIPPIVLEKYKRN